jgi:hypothetical protein
MSSLDSQDAWDTTSAKRGAKRRPSFAGSTSSRDMSRRAGSLTLLRNASLPKRRYSGPGNEGSDSFIGASARTVGGVLSRSSARLRVLGTVTKRHTI